MSDSSSGANSWTFVTSEVKESGVGVLAQSQDGTSSSGSEQQGPGLSQGPGIPASHAEETDAPDPPQVAPLDGGDDAAAALKADPIPSGNPPIENLSSLTSDPSERSPSNHGEGAHLLDPESETFSDSFAHTSPSPGMSPAPDTATQEGEELPQEVEEKSELLQPLAEEESKANSEDLDKEVNEDAGVRRRNVTVLTPHYHQDEDEEEDMEEHFQPPPKDDSLGFSLNKCIFGALVLLGLGTIFFSVGDADVGELKDPELEKEWANPESPRGAPVQPLEVLERLARDSEQIAKLQAQLQKQEEQLKAAQVQVEEGSKERLRREELEVENQRMKEELDKMPALQNQLEQETQSLRRVREGANLQGRPAMQKALEFLRAKAGELSQNADPVVPSTEHEQEVVADHRGKEPEDKKGGKEQGEVGNEPKKSRRAKAEGEKPWMERGSKKRDGKKKAEQEKEETNQEEGKELRGKGERKDERDKTRGRGHDDGKRWKDGGEKRKFKQEGGKGDGKDDAKRKKEKHGEMESGRAEPKEKKSSGNKVKEDKEWKHGREQKDWKPGKEWKKVEKSGGNDWKDQKGQRGGKKAWNENKEQEGDEARGGSRKDDQKNDRKRDQAQKGRTGKVRDGHHKGNGEKKAWKDQEEKRSGRERDWSKDKGTEPWKEGKKTIHEHQNGEKWHGKDKPVHSSSDKASHHSHSGQRNDKDHVHDNYWTKQRDRMRHYHGSTEDCADVTACARAEGLTPVPQRDFEALLLGYLTRVLGPEEQMSKKEELSKLVEEFFTDGVFIHDQIPFGEFVEDVADILEDVAEDEGNEEMEDEMEGFAREAKEKFALPDRRGNGEKRKGVSG